MSVRVLVTGANGFIGKNLVLRLRELGGVEVLTFIRGDSDEALISALSAADFVIHLAGENRPLSINSFASVNAGLTEILCHSLCRLSKSIPLLLASSTQATLNNPYGVSKMAAERSVERLSVLNKNPVAIFRLQNVFGKWCKPNYNSVVATFCHNKANDLPIQINDFNKNIRLVYVDDVVNAFLALMGSNWSGILRPLVAPEYNITLGELSEQIDSFKNCRTSLVVGHVGLGFERALYATYVSYLPKEEFAYGIPTHSDERGVFVEMLKTHDSGQISYFTAHPGVRRGGHYHHTKTEKFLVIKGRALFRFRHLITAEQYELTTSGEVPVIVDTIPGWTHDITNVGDSEMIVMLWANELFDRELPDTIGSKV